MKIDTLLSISLIPVFMGLFFFKNVVWLQNIGLIYTMVVGMGLTVYWVSSNGLIKKLEK